MVITRSCQAQSQPLCSSLGKACSDFSLCKRSCCKRLQTICECKMQPPFAALFYTYFLAAWVSNLSFLWFFRQRFPFTDVTKFCFTGTVSPGSILCMVRRKNKEKWNLEKTQIQQEYSPSSDRTASVFIWLKLFQLSSLPWCFLWNLQMGNTIKTVRATFHQRGENEVWMCWRFNGWWDQERNKMFHCSHQHSTYVLITSWQ